MSEEVSEMTKLAARTSLSLLRDSDLDEVIASLDDLKAKGKPFSPAVEYALSEFKADAARRRAFKQALELAKGEI